MDHDLITKKLKENNVWHSKWHSYSNGGYIRTQKGLIWWSIKNNIILAHNGSGVKIDLLFESSLESEAVADAIIDVYKRIPNLK